MPIHESILLHAVPFALVLARLSGLFVLAPILSSSMIPHRTKILLVAMFTLMLYPTVDAGALLGAQLELWTLVPLMATELLIGASVGALASIPFACVQLAGKMMGQQMGLALSDILNPAIDIEGDNISQMLFVVALAVFVSLGGFEIMFNAIAGTFASVALGGFTLTKAPLEPLIGILSSGFEMAIRISMPVIAIIFLENIAVGFISKTVPTLNIMSFGFPVRIIAGVFVLIAAIGAMHGVLADEFASVLVIIEDWAASP